MLSSEKYEIRNSDVAKGKSRGLFAKILFNIGDEILCKEECFLHQLDDKTTIPFVSTSLLDAALIDAAPFYGIAESLGELTSTGYSPLIDNINKEFWTPRARIADAVLNANAFEVGNGRAYFRIGSFANHSCSPNAIIQQIYDESGNSLQRPVYSIIAREVIKSGDEITISYVPRSWSKIQRQLALKDMWQFVCDCNRCTNKFDDTIVFRCSGKCYQDAHLLGDDYDGDAGGRIYLYTNECIDCKGELNEFAKYELEKRKNLDNLKEDSADVSNKKGVSELMLEPLLLELPTLPLALQVNKLLFHPYLAHEDVGIFTSLCSLMSQLQDIVAKEQADECLGVEATNLFSRVARAVALASMRTPYMSATDLGIEIDIQQ
jgi:hypothetical protein